MKNLDSMTWIELIQLEWPGCTKDEADILLWNVTAFPFTTSDTVVKQIREMHAKAGGSVEKALQIAHEETKQAMLEHRKKATPLEELLKC